MELLQSIIIIGTFGIIGIIIVVFWDLIVDIIKNRNGKRIITKHKGGNKKMRREEGLNIIGFLFKIFLVGIVFSIIVFGTIRIVPAGNRGVMLTFGKPNLVAVDEGLVLKFPIVQKLVRMNVQTQKYEAGASAASKDLQMVSTTIAVNYHLVPESTPKLYQEIGKQYESRIIQPAVQEVLKSITARFAAEELITKRPQVKEQIEIQLRERLQKDDIAIEQISITNFDFSESFNAAIEAKVTAEQLKLKAERDLSRIKVEKEQKITQAEAEAESIRIQSKALQDNPDILQLRAIEKWNGVMPKVTGGAVPFVDIGSVEEEQEQHED